LRSHAFRFVIPLLLACIGCADRQLETVTGTLNPGEPIAGLDPDERGRFDEGVLLFSRVFEARDGLGPFFNENQCSACHTDPASGGTGEQFAVRATHFEPPASCDLFEDASGENLQTRTVPALQERGIHRREAPPGASGRDRFSVPFLFGLGLTEAVPEAAILERADSEDRDGDGISGRPGRESGQLARFGRKAERTTIEGFIASALLFEMGLTSALRPDELLLDDTPWAEEVDPAGDPEIDDRSLQLLADFVRFLAPLAQRIPDDAGTRAEIAEGERLFAEAGCVSCHTPVLETGAHQSRALAHKRFRIYSDLLLHDMGPGLAGACGPVATPTEIRTEPLAGLGFRSSYLHDGRALGLTDAIRMHGGEAERARAAFDALDEVQQARLLRFLQSL